MTYFRDNARSATIGDLLLHSQALTTFKLDWLKLHHGNYRLHRMGVGLSASRTRLLSLSLRRSIDNIDELTWLAAIYSSTANGYDINNTVMREMDISDNCSIQGASGENFVRQLLEALPHLIKLNVSGNQLDSECCRELFRVIAAMGRLQCLSMCHCGIENEGLAQIGASNEDSSPIVDLDLSNNRIQVAARGETLGVFLQHFPLLETLHLSGNRELAANAQALAPTITFQVIAAMDRLQSLSMSDCGIDNEGLAQIVASNTNASSVVDLDFSSNRIQGAAGGASFAALLERCPLIETLNLYRNCDLDVNGAQALAPVITQLRCLQKFNIQDCHIEDGATAILTSLTVLSRLQCVNLKSNNLPPATLIPLAAFLNGAVSDCLEELLLFNNDQLFEVHGTDGVVDHQRPFFDAVASHKTLSRLCLWSCGMTEHTEGLLLSATLQNTSLVQLGHTFGRSWALVDERMERNKHLAKIEATMKKPTDISMNFWPEALAACTRQETKTGSKAPIYCVVQKMMESDNVFKHTAAVYRFEKVRACKRIQRWWQHRRR